MSSPLNLIFYDGENAVSRRVDRTITSNISKNLLITAFSLISHPAIRLRVVHVTRSGEKNFANADIDKNFDLKVDGDMTDFAFCWVCKFSVRSFNDGFTSLSLTRRVIHSFEYSSAYDYDANFAPFLRLTEAGVSKLVFHSDGEAKDLSQQSFLKAFRYLGDFNCFLMNLKDCYSCLTIPQVSDRIIFAQAAATSKETGKRQAAGEKKTQTLLSGMVADIPSDAMISLQKDFHCLVRGNENDWNQIVDHTVKSMSYLNNAYLASSELNEEARRLIINNIIIPVCSFL
jgi:hypothetical protein